MLSPATAHAPSPPPPPWEPVLATFRQIWGYEHFRPPQGEVVQCLLDRRDALIVMPTGGGKSICFQLPALLQSGLTLVISPLVALMENQVQDLKQRHLPAALLHSELSPSDRRRTLAALERQQLRLLYLSPETLLSPSVWNILSRPHIQINGVILDEAHCLVQWGDTFRPTYRRLGAVRPALLKTKPAGTKIPIAAFTATANPHAQAVIQSVLQLDNPRSFLINPYRANLMLKTQVAWTPRGRYQRLRDFIRAYPHQTGLVYVRTRRDSEALADRLTQHGLPTAAYHAGLPPQTRRQREQAWLRGELPFVVCTSAFGMGINKPDVRWVAHFHPPLLLSEYLQEVGRAGRDGQPATALALISEPTGWLDSEDKQRQQFFLDRLRSQHQKATQLLRKLPPQGHIQTVSQQFPDAAIALATLHSLGQLEWQDPFHYRLHPRSPRQQSGIGPAHTEIIRYFRTRECRWQFLLQAFGFTEIAQTFRCGHCDNCHR
ncbi:ATP-dependent DNA helicase [Trichothermofontia sichuanensis B231]|uniref:RecQ family ATP-dependent DNA helicase n=1 Tax=Trichothermofontia sichuanensis TaxID=3045816 RepID=UPI00224745B1|nr:ATP-dependent DNA helicase RecQ [Trichothermofontia sichuanensis]UZQ55921.1 ATP-dependent DNA helicase [Trichothermofontia sichuanensis B231]